MAVYHLSIQIISRGKGKSAIAAAAYRSGEKITSDYDGMTHDYTRKNSIVHTEILLPENALVEYINRSTLWNAVEQIEKNSNAQLAREIEISLPMELSHEQHIALVREYCKTHFVSAGMIADMCFHSPHPKDERNQNPLDPDDGENHNPHVHIMLTIRPFEQDGTWGAKSKKEYILDDNGERILLPSGAFKTRKIYTVDWNDQTKAEEWRQGWANIVNRHLAQHGIAERVDHRSYDRQGIDQLPTVHMGVAATQMERRGIVTDRGNINREIMVSNNQMRQLKARIVKLEKWLSEQTTEPNIQDIITAILSGGENKTRWQKSTDLKTAAKIFSFLQSNGITNMAQIAVKVTEMRGQLATAFDKLKAAERRYGTLTEHLKQADIFMKHKAVCAHYRQEKNPKKRDAFYQSYQSEIILFEAAERYLKAHLNGHAMPLKAWIDEHAQLAADRKTLYHEYDRLREDVRQVEVIQKNAIMFVGGDEPVSKSSRTKEAEI